MGRLFAVNVKGLTGAEKKLQGLNKAIIDGINDELLLAAIEIYEKAVRNIRSNGTNDQGRLLGGMTFMEDKQNRRFEVLNPVYYSPYIEFGTGQKVNVPAEWQAYAATFQGKSGRGSFDEFIDNLIGWMKRKGIVPDTGTDWDDYDYFAFMVALKILREGSKPHPFLYPAYQEVKKNLKERIVKILNAA